MEDRHKAVHCLGMPPEERNSLWRLFKLPEMQKRIENWEEIAQKSLAQFRRTYDRYAGDSLFEELVEKLQAVSPDFKRMWSNHDVLGKDSGYREVNHPSIGKMAFQHCTFQVYESPD